jgi:hypothetical protein
VYSIDLAIFSLLAIPFRAEPWLYQYITVTLSSIFAWALTLLDGSYNAGFGASLHTAFKAWSRN